MQGNTRQHREPGGAKARPRAVEQNPLDRIAREHVLQLQLCDALEHIADGLPARVDLRLVREVVNSLEHGMTGHFSFEEEVLFPLLRQKASGDASVIAALDQLESEHARDGDLSHELAEELRALSTRGDARNADMLAYMLRGYFEGQRRHIEWENSIVLPAARRLLTPQDLQDMGQYIRNGPRKLTSLRNLPRGRKRPARR